jgi:hypothetical protein
MARARGIDLHFIVFSRWMLRRLDGGYCAT